MEVSFDTRNWHCRRCNCAMKTGREEIEPVICIDLHGFKHDFHDWAPIAYLPD